MNHEEAGHYWNGNAEAWTQLSRAGFDVYRDYLNTPAFFDMLPDVSGKVGLDLGCGEGHNTRLLAGRGARMTAIDIAEVFIAHALECERQEPLGIEYRVASAVELPFPDESFDFAAAFMSLMDIPETELVLAEAYRVLKLGAFLQFSIEHPCSATPHRRNLRDENGVCYAIESGGYFDYADGRIEEWIFGAAPPELRESLEKFRTPKFTRTVSEWMNMLVRTGFLLQEVREPCPSDETVQECADMQDAQVVAYFLHFRVGKPD